MTIRWQGALYAVRLVHLRWHIYAARTEPGITSALKMATELLVAESLEMRNLTRLETRETIIPTLIMLYQGILTLVP